MENILDENYLLALMSIVSENLDIGPYCKSELETTDSLSITGTIEHEVPAYIREFDDFGQIIYAELNGQLYLCFTSNDKSAINKNYPIQLLLKGDFGLKRKREHYYNSEASSYTVFMNHIIIPIPVNYDIEYDKMDKLYIIEKDLYSSLLLMKNLTVIYFTDEKCVIKNASISKDDLDLSDALKELSYIETYDHEIESEISPYNYQPALKVSNSLI